LLASPPLTAHHTAQQPHPTTPQQPSDTPAADAAAAAEAAPAAPDTPAPPGLPLSLLVSQQNPIFAALLQRPKEAVSVTVERPNVAKVLRTTAALNLVLARQSGAGSVLVIPTELDEPAGGVGPEGGSIFSLRIQRVPADRRLPREQGEERSGRGVLRVRADARPERLAVAIVGGIMVGEPRRLEVRDGKLLPLALQGVSRARARLMEKGSGLDLAAVVYVTRRQQREGAAVAAAGVEGTVEGTVESSSEEEEEEAVVAVEGAAADAGAPATEAIAKAMDRLPRGRLGPPVYVLKLVTLEAPNDSGAAAAADKAAEGAAAARGTTALEAAIAASDAV